MTQDEIKRFIIEKRSDNCPFDEIASRLERETGEKFSRQRVYGIYKRSIDSMSIDLDRNAEEYDIINVFCRLGVKSAVKDVLTNADWFNCAVYDTKITNVINEHNEMIVSVNREMLSIVIDGISNEKSKENILERLRYKGIDVSDKVFNNLVGEAYKHVINDKVEKLIYEASEYSNDKSIQKELIKEFNIKNSLTVIMNKYRMKM